MTKRKGLGTNPLDAVIPTATTNGTHTTTTDNPAVAKQRFTCHISTAVTESARDAAWWTPGLTLAALVEGAIVDALAKLEAERGEPFPPRRSPLPRGGGPR